MILESTQMLCTALNLIDRPTPYKSAHVNHPCSKWVRESNQNWRWLYDHAIALSNEYTARYDKVHKCLGILKQIEHEGIALPDMGLTPFVNCTGDYADTVFSTELQYQLLLNDKWESDKRTPTWYGVGR